MRLHLALTIAAGPLLLAGTANAQPGPWNEPGDLPIPSDAMSVVVLQDDVPVEVGPTAAGQRRGTVAGGTALPFFAVKRGPGCNGRWFSIGPLAWVCQDRLRFSAEAPIAATDTRQIDQSDGLPYRYFFVGKGGSAGYAQLASVDQTAPDQELERGFAVAIVEQRRHDGEMFGRSHHGLWIPMRDLVPIKPRTFHGEQIDDGEFDFGWIVRDDAKALTAPEGGKPVDRRFVRFQKVQVLEQKTTARKERFYKIDGDVWLHERNLRQPTVAAPPPEVPEGQRWIDIDLASQTLVAYEGTRPVYATLASTGKGRQGTPFATPKGVHRIWVKLVGSNMDNLEDEEASNYYSIEDVPWVQYFDKGVGIHGAFWHNDFGHVRSHGCVNVTPLDAQWLFRFTGPHLPAGWNAVLPTDLEPGTVVRVR